MLIILILLELVFNFYGLLLFALPISIICLYYYSMDIMMLMIMFIYGTNDVHFNVHFKNKKNNTVCITVDDIPYDNTILEKILDLCKDTDHKITFFVISSYINDDNEHLLIRAIQEGHQLANHGISNTMHAIKSNFNIKMEIFKCKLKINILYKKAGVKSPDYIYYRPGCGWINKFMIKLVQNTENKLKLVLGLVYPHDPQIRSSLINNLYLKMKINENDIIILHDRIWSYDTIKALIHNLDKKNLKSVTLSNGL